MKSIIDKNGIEKQVPMNTPVKTINGVHYEHTAADTAEIKAYNDAYIAKAEDRRIDGVINARKDAYGSIESQIEFITEKGLPAWQAKVAQIKLDNPK